jgi:hypothetical protein
LDRFIGLVKVFIIVAGILIIGGTVSLIWLMVNRTSPDSSVERVVAAPLATENPPMAAGENSRPVAEIPPPPAIAELGVPAGAVVIDVKMAGSAGLLLLRTLEGQEYLALVDLQTGDRRSLIKLVPEAP